MKHPSQLPTTFTESVYSHAVADCLWPELRFRDRAAQELCRRLNGVGGRVRACKERVARSVWVDRRCRSFIARYPHCHFIALYPGLNTRFYRLSQATDWPRFCWWDVDGEEHARLKRQCLPVVDNHHLLGCDAAGMAEALWALRCQLSGPVMLIGEGTGEELADDQWLGVLAAARALSRERPVELVFDCLSPVRWLTHQLMQFYGAECPGTPRRTKRRVPDVPGELLCCEEIGWHRLLPGRWLGVHVRLTPNP